MTAYHDRSELAAIVQRTIRSKPLGDVAELAHAIVADIEAAGWTIANTSVSPIRGASPRETYPALGDKRKVMSAFSRRFLRKPIVVTVPHRLGRDEAKRRLLSGLEQVDRQIASAHASLEYSWEEYRINFSVMAMRQLLVGHTDVEDENIRIEIRLPLLLYMLADPLASRIESDTELLLRAG
jgi:hypothetical protein